MTLNVKKPRMVNRPDSMRSFGKAVQTGASLFGAAKSAWEIGKTILQVGRAAAPYIATAARTLALA